MLGSWAKGGEATANRKYTPEEIINKLRKAEVVIASGSAVAVASRRIGVSDQTSTADGAIEVASESTRSSA